MNSHKVKLLKFVLVLALYCCSLPVQAQAYYFYSGFDNTFPRQDVSTNGDFSPICTDNNGLPGLDLVRSYMGMASCPGNTNQATLENIDIHSVFLVNDTRPLSDYMLQAMREQDLLKSHLGRQIINTGVRSFTQEGEYSDLNVLVVGEMDYQIMGSADDWWQKIVVATGFDLSAEECDLSDEDQAQVTRFAQRSIDMNQEIKTAVLGALNNFSESMWSDSSYDARPQVGQAIAREAIDQAQDYIIGKIADEVPGFDVLIAFVEAANDEVERANDAARSHAISTWIQRARTNIIDCLGTVSCGASSGNNDEVQVIDLEYLESQIFNDICNLPENRRDAAKQRMAEAEQNMNTSRPSTLALEKGFYESWINGSYVATDLITSPAQGTIEIVWQVRENNNALRFDTASHSAVVMIDEYGDNAEDNMNNMIDQLSSVSTPLDFKVKKKVCFIVDNVMPAGRSRECAILDEDNRIINSIGGSTDMAQRAFQSNEWRSRTTRFKRN